MKAFIVGSLFLSLGLSSSAVARSVFIGIDASKSNPVAVDEASAKAASIYVRKVVASLQPSDEVHIRTFADRSAAHAGGRTFQLGRRLKPEMLADQVARYIRSLPTKPLEGSGETQILAFLELSQFRCERNSLVIVLTDGLESSPEVREKALRAGKPLPKPDADILKNCEVIFYGIGQSKDGSITREQAKKLKASWSSWMKTAGATFTPITG